MRMREWFRRGGRRRVIAVGLPVVIVAAAATTAVVLTGEGDEKPCWKVPAATAALAADPAAATKTLDPTDDLSRYEVMSELLSEEHLHACDGQGAILGKVVLNGATGGAGKPHTLAQARVAYAAASALSEDSEPLPAGMSPYVARLLADYIIDVQRTWYGIPDKRKFSRPAGTFEESREWAGEFPDPRDATAAFSVEDDVHDTDVTFERVLGRITADPEAFAVLYDAYRAYFAYYLERLDRDGSVPSLRDENYSTGKLGAEHDLGMAARNIGSLVQRRADAAQGGTIRDAAAFNRAVYENSRGTFPAASGPVTSTPPMGDITRRAAKGKAEQEAQLDGRHQLYAVLEQWGKDRKVSAGRIADLRVEIDESYLNGMLEAL
ncbi:hypothetical protein HRW23_32870 [Streptomyces lunaelactis]|uniref:hypothetical protein n=1 Tax=Streptomyces lunaelactis TaxID=1535768 RepID=UPI00158519F0|nr:hypothetical protein [Streptomyces lunaelactis]NUK44900.1 hypothetical protein [Streptomyces lunaelactis]NUK51284.1 hypothetical protein [Streptomyces lunaelactis]NUK56829.1 hypothetical protein [Streptomyces lunaelactis]NUK64700.1 hypothetical protein [Streptomyces lunaelactis]NUK82082.1 hypothetical protein [Streptomyces lunaelactis]